MFVDSHCHLDRIKLNDFENDFTHLIKRCEQDGIEHMLCVSIDLDTWPAMRELVADYPQISLSAGVHPMATAEQKLDTDTLDRLAQDEKVIAIGETGLDYYYHKGDKQWQQQRFSEHVQCAVANNKPVIIHTRDAGDDTLAILREQNAASCRGIIHCFTETMEFAMQAIDLGFMISFSGIVTFNNADALREVAASIPEDRLLIETDSPYLAPVPHRGKQNWPSLVGHVAAKIADVRNTSTEHIAEISRNNFYRLFELERAA